MSSGEEGVLRCKVSRCRGEKSRGKVYWACEVISWFLCID